MATYTISKAIDLALGAQPLFKALAFIVIVTTTSMDVDYKGEISKGSVPSILY